MVYTLAFPIIYCMAHVVQLKTIQNPTINCSEKRSKFLRSGKWHEEQFSSSQKACNQRTSAASFPRPSVFSFSFSQTKTKLSMGLCHRPTPNKLYPFGCECGCGCPSNANVLAVCESNFRSCPQLKSNIIWSRRKHRIELNFYDVFAKWLHKSQISQTGSESGVRYKCRYR